VLSKSPSLINFSRGKPQAKFFKLTKDRTELKWRSSSAAGVYSRSEISLEETRIDDDLVEMAAVMQVLVGPRSNVFKLAGYSWKKDRPWNCFTLICMDRTIDIECPDRQIVSGVLFLF